MNKIVVTGSNGQLGLTLQKKARILSEHKLDFKNAKELDISSPQKVFDALKNAGYTHCINCAAYTNVEQAEKTPEVAFKVNADGVKNLAKSCKAFGITLIHISTDYVFDGEKEAPYTVGDKPNPINEYGKSKLAGEKYIQEILPSHYIIRTSWLYSKAYGHNFYRTILNKAMNGEDLYVTDTQTGCPTNTVNLVKFIFDKVLSGQLANGIYHFTDGKPMTWYDFARHILEENGLAGKANLVLDPNYRTFAKRPKNSILS